MPLPELDTARIAILGSGREGRAAWRYLRARHPGATLTLLDEAEPDPAFADELRAAGRLVIGPLEDAGLEDFDLLLRSPGISMYRDCLQRARAAGTRVTTPGSLWFAAHPEARTICVTGTKGKSTTSALLAHVLAAAGHSVRLAGNIGRPLLDCDDQGVDWWVIELSSYQLADLEAQPSVSVLLNLSPEHLDWHRGEAAYRRDKLRLADLAGERPIVANAGDPVLRAALAGRQRLHWFNASDGFHVAAGRLCDASGPLEVVVPTGLPGAHNLANVAAALTVLALLGEDAQAALAAIADFRPLPHRLQSLGESGGLRFVNDSISSTPVATAAALEVFAGAAVALIVGGLDRGVDWTPYMPAFAAHPPLAVIGMPNNGPRVLAAVQAAGIEPAQGLHEAPDLAAAVALARHLAPPGAVVLLSPGAPSFPQFRDYRDRGRRFAALSGFELEETEPF
jgi:UDP-N-acetylmuramoylalanine--D-glutamate ligase